MADILVIGRSGQLASELARAPTSHALTFAGRDTFDLADLAQIAPFIAARAPNVVINAAAYTAVDKAESEEALALRINRDAPEALARACAEIGARFVHVSTDYVFAGDKPLPYVETDPKAPLGAYGRSKAAGEDAVLAAYPDACILRASWVFSPFGSNFVKTMLRLAETRDDIGVVADQIGRPTAAADLAAACLAASGASGLYHVSGAGDAAWADFAEAIFAGAERRGRKRARVRRISTAEYPLPARRPANSRLDASKIDAALGVRPRLWREALDICLEELLA